MFNAKPIGFNGAMQEGKASKMLGMPAITNPYGKEISRLYTMNKEPDSKLYELSSDWKSGWIRGTNN